MAGDETPRTHDRGRWVLAAVFLGAVVIVSVLGLRPFWIQGGDPTTLLRVGRYGVSRSAIEKDFDNPVLTGDLGHDGQQFYVLATTFPHLKDANGHVDYLSYRSRRILLPAIVSVAPDGAPTIWAMFGVNVLAVGAAAVGVACLARRLGLSPWLGLVVAITPAMVESVQGSLGDALAFALCVWAVVVWRKHMWWAAGLLVLGALSRETCLVVAFALFIVATPRARVAIATAVAAWAAIAIGITLAVRVPGDSMNDTLSQWAPPLTAVLAEGPTSPQALLAAVLFGGSIFAAWTLRHDLPEVSLWVLFDASLLLVVDEGIASRAQNLGRVTPMAIPAFALAAALTVRSRRALAMAD